LIEGELPFFINCCCRFNSFLCRGILFEADWVLWCEEVIEMIEGDREENP